MPSRRPNRSNRTRRQPPPRRVSPPVTQDDGTQEPQFPAQASVSTPARSSATTPRTPRTRSRAPAQIVIGNYDFLRHDLRILGVLAPGLVAVLVVLSFVLH